MDDRRRAVDQLSDQLLVGNVAEPGRVRAGPEVETDDAGLL